MDSIRNGYEKKNDSSETYEYFGFLPLALLVFIPIVLEAFLRLKVFFSIRRWRRGFVRGAQGTVTAKG
jgi:hypothetical protein